MTTEPTQPAQKPLINGLSADTSLKQPSVKPSQGLHSTIALDLRPMLEIWKNDVMPSILARTGYPTYSIGLPSLDDVIWGLHKRELLCLGARTSHGKSAFATQIAMNIADKGCRVIYFSNEMSKEQLVERIFSNMMQVNNQDLRRGMANDIVKQKDSTFQEMLKNWKLLIDDKYSYDYKTMIKVCDVIRPDFIFIDYIQMVAVRGHRNKLEAIEENIRGLKQIANERNVGVVVVSQINRSGIDNMSMANLKGAGILEEHSDTVILVNYDWEKCKFQVRVDKQRHGICKSLELKFEREFFRFCEQEIPANYGGV